jgi:type IV secretion system protein VirD4
MNKTKFKIGLFLVLSIIGLIIGFFFAGYINLLLTGGSLDDISALHPDAIIESLTINERHRMLTLCIELVTVAGIAALMLVSRRETFESDTSAIAGTIKTPVAIGQGQHGTARWLKKAEQKKAFSVYRLDESEMLFGALLDAGEHDRKEVPADNETAETLDKSDKTDNNVAAVDKADDAPKDAAAETKSNGTTNGKVAETTAAGTAKKSE